MVRTSRRGNQRPGPPRLCRFRRGCPPVDLSRPDRDLELGASPGRADFRRPEARERLPTAEPRYGPRVLPSGLCRATWYRRATDRNGLPAGGAAGTYLGSDGWRHPAYDAVTA